MSVADLRKEYMRHGLSEIDLDPDPIVQFQTWFAQALAAGLPEPNAMTLATATPDGRPSARMVLIKGLDARGFVFFSNYISRKGRELAANPYAALVFYWPELERQIRIEGRVELTSPEDSDAYFRSRPLGSQLGALASQQSAVIDGRADLERCVADLAEQYADGGVPRPPHWGGYRVIPMSIEFWQGRPSRLHDRLRYRRLEDESWLIERLSP
jgi:pyridoxamine 5'-phosphate oxidase